MFVLQHHLNREVKKMEKGFTLLELLIVIVIVGILATVAIPNYFSIMNKAKDSSVRANMYIIQSAVEEFAVRSNGMYPALVGSRNANGDSLKMFCPQGEWPINPFTKQRERPEGLASGTRGQRPSAPTNLSKGKIYFYTDGIAPTDSATATLYTIYGVSNKNTLLDSIKN